MPDALVEALIARGAGELTIINYKAGNGPARAPQVKVATAMLE